MLLWLGLSAGRAQEALAPTSESTLTSTPQSRLFRIGYLRADPESQLSSAVFRALREYLLADSAFVEAMKDAKISDIVLLSSDSHQDLIQRMDQNEFDLVFCSAVDFVLQVGDYDALFQLRRPKDSFDPGGKRVFSRGVIFVNNRSPLFTGELSAARLAGYLARQEIATVSSFSAAGYVYPMLKIASFTSDTLPRRIFCDSSQEVVKYVINGVTEIGACEGGVLEEVLNKNGLGHYKEQLVRVVLDTDPVPTEPVALRELWLPRHSPVGRELRSALRQFFSRSEFRLPRLENSSREKFDDLKQNMQRLRRLY